MKHVDILIHVITLLSGIITALLGFLLYLKYRLKEIRYYALFISCTTLAVITTTVNNYLAYNVSLGPHSRWPLVVFWFFEASLVLINLTFTLFALSIINKPFTAICKTFAGIPALLVTISLFSGCYYILVKNITVFPRIMDLYFLVILCCLFLTLVIYSVRIAINLKNIANLDLKRALKVLALIVIVYIPLQFVFININRQWMGIMISRNLFYFAINLTSIIFAAKYFFIETPSIMDRIEISDYFLKKYGITNREKEVIALILSGLSIKEISGQLDRSFKTVNNHIYNIYQKTGVSSKLELLNLIKENNIKT